MKEIAGNALKNHVLQTVEVVETVMKGLADGSEKGIGGVSALEAQQALELGNTSSPNTFLELGDIDIKIRMVVLELELLLTGNVGSLFPDKG